MNELVQEESYCEICGEDKLCVTWDDGEYRNSVCYDCVDKCKNDVLSEQTAVKKE